MAVNIYADNAATTAMSKTAIEVMTDYLNKALKDSNKKYVFIRTPFCIHCYKGTSVNDSVNVEFFPYDYVKEDITDDQYKNYLETVKKQVVLERHWNDIYKYYETELNNNPCLTKEKTSRITTGFNNFAQTQYRFNGFLKYEDYYPLTEIDFENQKITVPNNYLGRIENLYRNWKAYPSDVGISTEMRNLREYFDKAKIEYKEEDFIY